MHLAIGSKAVQICGRGGYPANAGSYEIGMRLMEIGDFFNEDCSRRGSKGLSGEPPPAAGRRSGHHDGEESGQLQDPGPRPDPGDPGLQRSVPGPGNWGYQSGAGAPTTSASTSLAMSGCHSACFTTAGAAPSATPA